MPRGEEKRRKRRKRREKEREKERERKRKGKSGVRKNCKIFLKISMATMNAVVDPKPLFMEWLEKWRSDAARQRNNTQFM